MSIVAATLLWCDLGNRYVWIVLGVLVCFGGIGWLDDYLKITEKSSRGLSAGRKYLWQSVFGFIAAVVLYTTAETPAETALIVPFFKEAVIPLGLGFVVLTYLMIVFMSNAVNLTDGLDGLATLPTVMVASALGLVAYLAGNSLFADYLQIPYIPGAGELAVLCGALIGAGLGFLWFNTYPAQVIMGDLGALALGAMLGVVAVVVRHEIVLLIMGGLFVVEAGFGDRAGDLLSAHRQAHLPDGAHSPPLRTARLARTPGDGPNVDHHAGPRADRPVDVEAAMTGSATLILGLGATGYSCIRHLAGRERLLAFDTRETPPFLGAVLSDYPDVDVVDAASWPDALGEARRVVVSPGVAMDHEVVVTANAANVPVTSDIELFLSAAHRPVVGVTGTNGKSTVATLVGKLFAAGGQNVGVGGNLGTPALDLLGEDMDGYVLELSSFQLERLDRPRLAVGAVLNVSADHLDRYPDLASYAAAKRRIFRGARRAVYNADDVRTRPDDPVPAIALNGDPGWRIEDDELVIGGRRVKAEALALNGRHNQFNALAAAAIVHLADVEVDLGALVGFRGLPQPFASPGRGRRCVLRGRLEGDQRGCLPGGSRRPRHRREEPRLDRGRGCEGCILRRARGRGAPPCIPVGADGAGCRKDRCGVGRCRTCRAA